MAVWDRVLRAANCCISWIVVEVGGFLGCYLVAV